MRSAEVGPSWTIFGPFFDVRRVAEAESRMKNEDFFKAHPVEVVARPRSGKIMDFLPDKVQIFRIFLGSFWLK